MPTTVCKLVDAVIEAYEEVGDYTLNHVWLSLMGCMTDTLTKDESNNYKLPYIGKATTHSFECSNEYSTESTGKDNWHTVRN